MMRDFHTRCPQEAEQETRTVTVLQHGGPLPKGTYGFIELYCDEDDCDCRRVVISVLAREKRKVVATLNYGWEKLSFYRRWIKGPWSTAGMRGVTLEPGVRQSRHAEMFRQFFADVLLNDRAYYKRIQRHYRLFKASGPK